MGRSSLERELGWCVAPSIVGGDRWAASPIHWNAFDEVHNVVLVCQVWPRHSCEESVGLPYQLSGQERQHIRSRLHVNPSQGAPEGHRCCG